MQRRMLAGLLVCLLLFLSGARAESVTGVITPARDTAITIDETVTLGSVLVNEGDLVQAGQILALVQTTKLYAPEDGIVARVLANIGDRVDKAVIQLRPISRYTVYCTVDSAYQSEESTLVHAGETLYIKCTADGTHRGRGIIVEVTGNEYRLIATAGELQVGETVYLYRDSAFSARQRVGIGTVVTSDPISCEASGTLVKLCVSPGEEVQRGELLCEVSNSVGTEIRSPVDGIVTACPESGATLPASAQAFTIVSNAQLCVQAQVDEQTATQVSPGSSVRLIFSNDPEETAVDGTVVSVTNADGQSTLQITCDEMPNYIGMTVEVFI